MSVTGVGALIAVTFASAADNPERFAHSRVVSAFWSHPEEVPIGRDRHYGSGEPGRRSDGAHILLTRAVRFSALSAGGGQALRHAAGQGGAGPQAYSHTASHVD
jgi:hypothetical protein